MSYTAIIFVIVFLLSIYSVFFIDAYYGILMYIVLYFFNPQILWWGSSLPDIRYIFLMTIFTIISFFLHYEKYKENHLFKVSQIKWLISLIILMGLVSFIAVWPINHQKYYWEFIKFQIFTFLMIKLIDSPEKFEKVMGIYIFSAFHLGWQAHSIGRQGAGRLGTGVIHMSGGSDENGIAAVLATSVPLLLFYILEGKRWQKLASFIAVPFIFDGMILCNSRGAVIALVVSLTYMSYVLLFKRVLNFKGKFKVICGIGVAIFLFLYLTDSVFFNRMDTLKKGSDADGSGEVSRIYFWKKALEVARDHPFGTGAGGFIFLSPQYLPAEVVSKTRQGKACHSTYFQFLAEYGYLGLMLFIGLLLSNFNMVKNLKKTFSCDGEKKLYLKITSLEASLIVMLVVFAFIDGIYGEELYWLIGFIATYGNIYLIKPAQNIQISKD